MNHLFQLISQTEVPVGDVFTSVMALLGGVKGASVLGVVVLVVQVLMQFFSSSLAGFAGKYKLLIVYGLSLVGVVLGNLTVGGSFWMALVAGNVIAAAQVFGNQVWKQFFEKDISKSVKAPTR